MTQLGSIWIQNMKTFFVLLFFLLLQTGQAQELQTGTRRSPITVEVFQSKKKNPGLLEGSYLRRTRQDKKIIERGRYAEGNRMGVWEFYDYGGQIELRYDYENRRAWFPPDPDTLRTMTWAEGDWRPIKLQRAPRPMGSALLASYAFANLPKATGPKLSWKRADLRLYVRIDTAGGIRQINVVHPFGDDWERTFKPGLRECVETLIWLPGLRDGKPVESIWEMAVSATPRLTVLPK